MSNLKRLLHIGHGAKPEADNDAPAVDVTVSADEVSASVITSSFEALPVTPPKLDDTIPGTILAWIDNNTAAWPQLVDR